MDERGVKVTPVAARPRAAPDERFDVSAPDEEANAKEPREDCVLKVIPCLQDELARVSACKEAASAEARLEAQQRSGWGKLRTHKQ